MNSAQALAPGAPVRPPRPTAISIVGHVLLNATFLLIAAAALVAYEHFSTQGDAAWSTGSLVVAAGFALAPLRALLHAVFTIERSVMHVVHGVGSLAMIGMVFGGVQGRPVLTRAAMTPFAMMGAAQAVMHQNHPRDAAQAAALQQFASSLPEVAAFTKGDLASPENARRAVAVLTDLVGKAEALGRTELRGDPGFQSALTQVTTRFGVSLGLDAIDQTLGQLSTNPAVARQLPALRMRVARARALASR